MHTPFFITGLPQSRTSWLANLFSTGGVFCHHDLLGGVDSVETFLRVLRGESLDGRVGDSDSGLLACYATVMQSFPGARWVLVQREFEEAWNSLCQFVATGDWQEKLSCTWELHEEMARVWEQASKAMVQDPRCMVVPYESLERTDMIEIIWKHCVPGVRFDRRRAEMLQQLSVRPYQAKAPIRPALELVKDLWPSSQAS